MIENFIKYGRSGCKFILQEGPILTKISKDVNYNNRLYKQYIKQKNFKEYLFNVPKVYSFSDQDNICSFNMDYIYGKTFLDFCLTSNISKIKNFFFTIIEFLKNEFDNSVVCKIDKNILLNKVIELEKINKIESINIYLDYLKDINFDETIIGKDHGDFTLSNIIFSDNYYLIDFLDNIFDSPINDLIKIRQDTYHNFYNMISRNEFLKIKTSLDFLDKMLIDNFKDIINSEQYNWFSILNLLRIIPYMKEEYEIEELKKEIFKYEYIITSRK